MFHSSSNERRQHKRFMVEGTAKLRNGSEDSTEPLEVLNIGRGGLLLVCSDPAPVNAELNVLFTIRGFNRELSAKAKVVRHAPSVVALEFSQPPEEMEDLVG